MLITLQFKKKFKKRRERGQSKAGQSRREGTTEWQRHRGKKGKFSFKVWRKPDQRGEENWEGRFV